MTASETPAREAELEAAAVRDGDDGQHLGSRGLLKNVISLFILQGVNFLVPLLLTPYLARTFGVDPYGRFAIAANLVTYFVGLTEWGFAMGATQEVARIRSDPVALADFVQRTVGARMIMGGVALLLLLGLAAVIPDRSLGLLLAAGAVGVGGAAFGVDWLLQGLERMEFSAIIGCSARFLSIPATFLLVHGPSDVWISVVVQGSASVIAAVLGWTFAARALGLGLIRPRFRQAVRQILQYRHFYFANLSITIYTLGAPVVLGIVSGHAAVGIFAGADRISRAALQVINQFSNAMFPRVNAILSDRPTEAPRLLRGLLSFQLALTCAMSATMFVMSPLLVSVLLGPAFHKSIIILRILSLLPFLVGVSNIFGIQIMVPLGMKRSFLVITSVSAALYLLILAPLGHFFGAFGAAISLTSIECLVAILFAAAAWRGAPVLLAAVLNRRKP